VLTGVAELMRDAPDELVIQPAARVGAESSRRVARSWFAYAGPPQEGRRHIDAVRGLAVPLHERTTVR